MAFNEGNEPRTRKTSTGARRVGGRSTATAADPQTLLVRRLVAGGLGLILVILLVVAVDGCIDSRRQSALKDYNREVASVIQSSDREVARPFFELLRAGGQSPVELESAANQLRVTAERQLRAAEEIDVPDDLRMAHNNLLLTLSLRAEALGEVASKLRTAMSNERGDTVDEATRDIAGQMQAFLTSDVVYSQRVIPFIRNTFEEEEIGGQTIATTQSLPSLEWLSPETVAQRLDVETSSSGRAGGEAAPGLHGHGIESVSVAGETLQPGEVANRIPAGANLTFDVKFANQGEHDENDVTVRTRIRGAGDPITATKRIDQTKAGQSAEVSIPLAEAPPIGTPVTIEVSVEPVAGEKKTDNNKQTYTAIFTR